jgi:importin subunit beta-1
MEQALEIVLQKSKTGNPVYTREAEEQVKLWESDESYAQYAFTLAVYMATPTKPTDDRVLCAVLLRGTLWAKDPELHEQKRQKWVRTPMEAKHKIKQICISLMNDPVPNIGNQAAQIVAKIALIELPMNAWPELIPMLLAQSTQPETPANLKKNYDRYLWIYLRNPSS